MNDSIRQQNNYSLFRKIPHDRNKKRSKGPPSNALAHVKLHSTLMGTILVHIPTQGPAGMIRVMGY